MVEDLDGHGFDAVGVVKTNCPDLKFSYSDQTSCFHDGVLLDWCIFKQELDIWKNFRMQNTNRYFFQTSYINAPASPKNAFLHPLIFSCSDLPIVFYDFIHYAAS